MKTDSIPHPRRILSIDGGGIKGVMAAAYLADVEETLNVRICEHFDLIVGTSTGGIISLALGLGIPAQEILDLYEEKGPQIFSQDVPAGLSLLNSGWHGVKSLVWNKYSPATLRKELIDLFGERKLGESKTRLVIPAYGDEPPGPHIFKTAHDPKFKRDYKQTIVDVALATSAAPSYFPKHILSGGEELIDGGVWANNPIGVAALEATAVLNWDPKLIQILSLGYTSEIVTYPRNGGLIQLGYGGKIVELLMAGQARTAMSTAKLLLKSPSEEGRIIREELTLKRDYFKMDDTKKIKRLIGLARAMSRAAMPRLERSFFSTPCEPFEPYLKVKTDANEQLPKVA